MELAHPDASQAHNHNAHATLQIPPKNAPKSRKIAVGFEKRSILLVKD